MIVQFIFFDKILYERIEYVFLFFKETIIIISFVLFLREKKYKIKLNRMRIES